MQKILTIPFLLKKRIVEMPILGLLIAILLFSTGWGIPTEKAALYYYIGAINNESKVQMNLEFDENSVSGSYIVESTGEIFVLEGATSEVNKNLMLNVFNKQDALVARLVGSYYNNDIDKVVQIKGQLVYTKSNRVDNIQLDKVAEYISRFDNITHDPTLPSLKSKAE